MKWDHVIKNGIIYSDCEFIKGNLYIKDGKIAAIASNELSGEAVKETNAEGLYVLPGFIDTHIHSRDPGPTYKEDFYYSTRAAAAGGITTVFEMPNTNPPINTVENFNKQKDNLTPKAHVDFGIWGICLGDINRKDILPLHKAGVIGFKFFWGYAINSETYQLMYNYKDGDPGVIPPLTDGEVYDIFKEVEKTGQILAIHAENNQIIQRLTDKVEAEGRNDYEALLDGRPNLAEEVTIQTGIAMAKNTGARLHILHVSTAEGVKHVRRAQAEGYPITSETCPHYLFLSNEDYEKIGPQMKVYPPVKYRKDQNELWKGIKDGTVSIACSDHAPHTEAEKDGELWSIPAGICGVETLAPLMLNAVSEGKITLNEAVAVLAENPAKQYGIYPKKGSLAIGSDADLTIVDMNKEMVIKRENLHSKSKVTAFDGFKVKGVPVGTIVRGTTVMENHEIVSSPYGQLVVPE
ncbi:MULTISPECIES: allantoinase AllB [Bacillus]|uniref:allantoinase n=2 Tax=Bacillus TaxID=1386 RepID=A0A0M5JDW8_9BACI|nr:MULTISPECIES: allantoinase AllB [Bacillus]ALC80377.1 dihydroorotase [Bacillus gobiensis]MBP1083776.1 allantoinase [Bacillus capparidis]MED1098261.1 allantoinase AllB [Bacillus capparidis]